MLRGMAILGILVMNIQAFAMPWPAYANPHAYGSLEGIHGWVYTVSHLFFDTKFYSLFALMFGAGLALMSERARTAGQWDSAIHYRRMLLLALIGLLHGTLLWYGDILLMYAVCGSAAWLFRRKRAATQLVLGIALVAIPPLIGLLTHWSMSAWPPGAVTEMAASWAPDSPLIERELAVYSGGYWQQVPYRSETYLMSATWGLALEVFWQATGLMLLGMALFRWGVLTAARSLRFYRRLLVAGIVVGLGLSLSGLAAIEAKDWAFPWTRLVGSQLNNLGAPLLALAWLSLAMLLHRSARLPRTRAALAAIGRTALSNYLLQTLLCTSLFYGHGLGLFGQVERAGQLLVVLAVWAIQIPLSVWWLRHFHQGPVEWLWRTVARLEPPPFRRRTA